MTIPTREEIEALADLARNRLDRARRRDLGFIMFGVDDVIAFLSIFGALTEAEATIARQRECVAQWIIKQGCATGHGDTIEALLTEFEWQLQARIAIADATAARLERTLGDQSGAWNDERNAKEATIARLTADHSHDLNAVRSLRDAAEARANSLSSQVETLRKERDEAFAKGAEAMRELAAQRGHAIRCLPLPEREPS